tara:strand:+ start:193 stop:378 length:186 start_codon:yes stop_codon:yes gene_type:complete
VRLSDITQAVKQQRDSWNFNHAVASKLFPSLDDINSNLDILAQFRLCWRHHAGHSVGGLKR